MHKLKKGRRELTCHFKQAGLKLGFRAAASSAVVKTYREGVELGEGQRAGSGFGGRTRRGKESKTRRMGVGTGIDQEGEEEDMVEVRGRSEDAGRDDGRCGKFFGNVRDGVRMRSDSRFRLKRDKCQGDDFYADNIWLDLMAGR